MNTSYELNNARKDAELFNGKFTKNSPVVEIFSAMVNGESLDRFGKKADAAVAYIKNLGEEAANGNYSAISELNTLRRMVIENPILDEMKFLSIFGSYTALGMDETVEREVYTHAGELAREQANNGDVVFPTYTVQRYQVPTFTVSGGYAVDYRRVALGDMAKENEGINLVKTTIRNKATAAIIEKVYAAIANATGVKYSFSGAGLTKAGVDGVLASVRRYGKPTILGDYATISQFTPWAGYAGAIGGNTITGISEKAMNEIAENGLLGMYNGSVLAEIPNTYNPYELNANGTDFNLLNDISIAFVVPAGVQSPIATYTRGGLTSFTGNNIHTGKVETRFDLEVGCDVAKGQEYKIGILHDTNL